jgi:hypothetical protein
MVDASGLNMEELMADINQDAGKIYGPVLKTMASALPDELMFHYDGGQSILYTKAGNNRIGILWKDGGMACLIEVKTSKNAKSGTLEYYISKVADFFGIEKIYLFGKRGSGVSLPLLSNMVLDKAEEFSYPEKIKRCDTVFCGKFSYDRNKGLLGEFFYLAFGLKHIELMLFAALSSGEFLGYAKLPVVETKVLSVRDLYLGIECGKDMSLMLEGTFLFSFLPGISFYTSSSVGTKGFNVEAVAVMNEPVKIFNPFKLGSAALSIGVAASGLDFRMYANLYIGEIKTFGAIGLRLMSGTVEPEFLCAAITDVSLAKLLKNLFGKNVGFADALDFLELSGLPLASAGNKTIALSKNKNVKDAAVKSEVVKQFNEIVHSSQFAVTDDGVNLERIQGVTGEDVVVLTDKSRMRHYSINSKGKLSLQAQFYYSLVDVQFGEYSLKKGIFTCGSITLFKKFTVRALFAMSESEGVLAYASISGINLGILSIGASGIPTTENPLSHFPENSLLWLLADKPNKAANNAVFFLHCSKQECSFYIDGKIILFGFWGIAAKICYVDKYVNINVGVSLGLINMMLQVGASYEDFSSMNFKVCLIIDCNNLEKVLKGAQAKINEAINRLRNKIDSDKKKLVQAQNHVNELHSQINQLNYKIDDCRNAIRSAKWWKKAYVAIVKGAEIAAYEVAKAGLYAAIGVANAALEVAKLAVNVAGVVGEGVLRFVNAAIECTLNMFFVKYIRLEAQASTSSAEFAAEIEFVALGKTYKCSKSISAGAFQSNPQQMLDNSISNTMSKDLDNIESGSFRSNRRRYKKLQCSMLEYRKMVNQGMQQLQSGETIIKGINDLYLEHCGELPLEHEQCSLAYGQALSEVESVLSLAENSIQFDQMDNVVDILDSAMEDPDKKISDAQRQKLEPAIAEYKVAKKLAATMSDKVKDVSQSRTDIAQHMQDLKDKESVLVENKTRMAGIPAENAEALVNDAEELLYECYPPTKRNGSYINLGRERKVVEGFDDIRTQMGLEESSKVKNFKNKKTPVKYEERL